MNKENRFNITASADMLIDGYVEWMRRSGMGEAEIEKEKSDAMEHIAEHFVNRLGLSSLRTTDPFEKAKYDEAVNGIGVSVSKARRLIADSRPSLADVLEQISANGTDVNDPDSVQVFHWLGDRELGLRHSCDVNEYKRHHSAENIPVDCVSVTEEGLIRIDVAPESERRI